MHTRLVHVAALKLVPFRAVLVVPWIACSCRISDSYTAFIFSMHIPHASFGPRPSTPPQPHSLYYLPRPPPQGSFLSTSGIQPLSNPQVSSLSPLTSSTEALTLFVSSPAF